MVFIFTNLKSLGIGAVNVNLLLEIGWMNDNLYEWRACLLIKGELVPYKVSPKSGCPICAICTRIWCVLPSFKNAFNNSKIRRTL